MDAAPGSVCELRASELLYPISCDLSLDLRLTGASREAALDVRCEPLSVHSLHLTKSLGLPRHSFLTRSQRNIKRSYRCVIFERKNVGWLRLFDCSDDPHRSLLYRRCFRVFVLLENVFDVVFCIRVPLC